VWAEALLGRLRRPGAWLWLALLAGALLRAWLVLRTEGSFDVAITLHHGRSVHELGLLESYRRGAALNHPPLAGRFFEAAWVLAGATGISYRVLLRAPFALVDAGAAGVLFTLFRGSPWRYAVVAGYWLHPLAWLFSAYHGNTDSLVAFTVLLALLSAARGRPALAGAALGLGAGIKLPAVLAAPALFFALEGRRARLAFLGAAGAAALAAYLPTLALEPRLLARRIFGYPGSGAETVHGVPIWGVWSALGLARVPGLGGAARLATAHNALACLAPIAAVAWARRGCRDASGIGATLFASFMILYGLTSHWAFQYLAWSAPLWFFRGKAYAALGSLLLGGYVYGVYAFYCGNPWLLGVWDHAAHVSWPLWLRLLRDAAVAFCFASTLAILAEALRIARRGRGAGEGGP
jgi:hypothetical protein